MPLIDERHDELVAQGLLPDPMAVEGNYAMVAGYNPNPLESVCHELLALVMGQARLVGDLQNQINSQRETIVKFDRAVQRCQNLLRAINVDTPDGVDDPTLTSLFGPWRSAVFKHALADIN